MHNESHLVNQHQVATYCDISRRAGHVNHHCANLHACLDTRRTFALRIVWLPENAAAVIAQQCLARLNFKSIRVDGEYQVIRSVFRASRDGPRWIAMDNLDDVACRILACSHRVNLSAEIEPHFATVLMIVLPKRVPERRQFTVTEDHAAGLLHAYRAQYRRMPLNDDVINRRILVCRK